jgi:hypothetical protein
VPDDESGHTTVLAAVTDFTTEIPAVRP